ncbi:acyl-CoA dehydrogenase family protein [uncultured Hyphomonas sp.]|uniref:acyl-CoA dehydrogenase family protein n=1 Tax=uncultured Hyphomonas sp. TaxID=225298 RepID=UPI002616FE4C|nr:acyl-CoA dehydrogenase family protein [uncultured Hyphomonas sp.]
MDFNIPQDIADYLTVLDKFIEDKIKPLEQKDDNIRFFDHRREWARTDFDNDGLPRPEWEDLLRQARKLADEAGHLRYALPKEFGGQDGSNLGMAIIREHFARKGLGLHNDLQNEHSIVGNFPQILMLRDFARPDQKHLAEAALKGEFRACFGLTEPDHGSDATHMETRAVRHKKDGKDGWLINGSKMWITGMHAASHIMMFCRTSGNDGDAKGITCLITPARDPAIEIDEYMWTFNMPTDHARFYIRDLWVPEDAVFGPPEGGLALAQHFVHENRIRQAASSVGAAMYCITEAINYANERKPFGKALSHNQAIQFPLVELATQCEMLRLLIYKTAWDMDNMPHEEIEKTISDKVSMCNYWANRLVCEAADRAMQVHGGIGYSRHKPFEHIYRHHRRYRITEGAEEIQMRKVGAYLFGYLGPRRGKFTRS